MQFERPAVPYGFYGHTEQHCSEEANGQFTLKHYRLTVLANLVNLIPDDLQAHTMFNRVCD